MNLTESMCTELTQIFTRMDQAYARVADGFGFVCAGCRQSCCETLFYHHTLAELLYLKSGLLQLTADERERIGRSAAAVLDQMKAGDAQGAHAQGDVPAESGGPLRPVSPPAHDLPAARHPPFFTASGWTGLDRTRVR